MVTDDWTNQQIGWFPVIVKAAMQCLLKRNGYLLSINKSVVNLDNNIYYSKSCPKFN